MGKGFAEKRRVHGWTQEELAARAGVSQSLVSDFERGRKIRPDYAEKIERALAEPAEFTRNSSDASAPGELPGQTEQTSSTDGAMNSRHLSAVHPVGVAPHADPVIEAAIGDAFDARVHRLSDAKAVERIASRIPLDDRSPTDLRAFFRELLDAASRLRERDAEISEGSLLVETWEERRKKPTARGG